MAIVVRPAAAADIEEACHWYESQRAGLGNEFLLTVQSAIEEIAAHPTRYAVVHRNTRRILLHRFPYGVFYRHHGDDTVVVACMHGRRDPRKWKSRN